jgi:hypothetical protein
VLRDAINAGRRAMEEMRGDTIQLLGVAGTWTANVAAVASNPTLAMGGFLEGITLMVFTERAQFDAAGVAITHGMTLIFSGRRYKITAVDLDESKYVLGCTGMNR